MDLEAAKTVVSQRGWLSYQPGAFRDELLRRAALRSYCGGEYIYHLEDAPGMMFGIVEGAVIIGVPHPIVGLYQAHLGRPGDWYGEAAALHGVTRRVAVEARVPVQILYLSIEAVQEMLQEQPSWQRNLSSLLLWNLENAIRTRDSRPDGARMREIVDTVRRQGWPGSPEGSHRIATNTGPARHDEWSVPQERSPRAA